MKTVVLGFSHPDRKFFPTFINSASKSFLTHTQVTTYPHTPRKHEVRFFYEMAYSHIEVVIKGEKSPLILPEPLKKELLLQIHLSLHRWVLIVPLLNCTVARK